MERHFVVDARKESCDHENVLHGPFDSEKTANEFCFALNSFIADPIARLIGKPVTIVGPFFYKKVV